MATGAAGCHPVDPLVKTALFTNVHCVMSCRSGSWPPALRPATLDPTGIPLLHAMIPQDPLTLQRVIDGADAAPQKPLHFKGQYDFLKRQSTVWGKIFNDHRIIGLSFHHHPPILLQ